MPRRNRTPQTHGGGQVLWLESDLHRAWERTMTTYRIAELERRYGPKRDNT